MDDSRFDDFTRALARGRSRRQVLAGLVGGVAAGLAALRGREIEALAARNQPAGAPCARGTECASRFCVDGVCCTSPCTGQCESCATGTCSPVSGAPVGNRPACPGSGDCAATCNGQHRTACVFPGAETACGAPECDGDVQITYACAGNGTCHPTTTSCGPDSVCCAGSCCPAGQECIEGTCQDVEVCRVLTESCDFAEQCCQDEPTNCEIVPQSGANEPQCCRPRGGACTEQFLDCCGTDECIGGVCVANCHPFGLECFVDEHCCDGLVCADTNTCQAAPPICLALLEECTAADQCCQDEPTGCADVLGCGGSRIQCCRLPGGACGGSCDCCGADQCVDGACVASCVDLGQDCTADEHCCVGICDQSNERCFDPTLAVPCDNPIDPETCSFTGECQGCEIDGACITSCGDMTVACVTTVDGLNSCVVDAKVAGRGCLRTSECPAGHSCFDDCDRNRGCFPDFGPICIFPTATT